MKTFDTVLGSPKVILFISETLEMTLRSLGNIWSTSVLLPKIWLKNGWKSPFSTFLKVRGVLRDEFLWSHFFTSEKYDIRAFQNRAECPHTTSGYFFSISWKIYKTTRIFVFFGVTRKYSLFRSASLHFRNLYFLNTLVPMSHECWEYLFNPDWIHEFRDSHFSEPLDADLGSSSWTIFGSKSPDSWVVT